MKFTKPITTAQGLSIPDAFWVLTDFRVSLKRKQSSFTYEVYMDQAHYEGGFPPFALTETPTKIKVNNKPITVDEVEYEDLFDSYVLTSLVPSPGLKTVLKTLVGDDGIVDVE